MLAREAMPRPLRRLLVGSAVVHLVLFVGVAYGGKLDFRKPRRPENTITTKLVKLGVKRDEQLMPRLPAAPPPPPAKTVNLSQAPTATPPAPAASDARDRLGEIAKVSNALSRIKSLSAETEGDPDGVEEGEVTDAALAMMGSKYHTEIYSCMKKHYVIEGVPPQMLAGKKVVILVHVQPDGRLVGGEILEPSGVVAFDSAVKKSVKLCGKVSPPPDAIKPTIRDGLEVVFNPT